jgi:hypothetical protein
MTNVLEPHDYNESVFINCPFDSGYEPLLQGIIFAVRHMNLKPKSALESSDAGQLRFDKILALIENCKYSIHDICRTEVDPNHGLPRFNVPFELGLDLGCKRYGKPLHEDKTALILDIDRHRYRTFISDIAGLDVEAHNGNVPSIITVVRNWLGQASETIRVKPPSGTTIYARYQAFQVALPGMCDELKWDVDNLPFLTIHGRLTTGSKTIRSKP